MKITDLQMEHYGIYRGESWQPAQDKLIVVMGENESGKTTLLHFIRDMIFGYRRGEWRDREGNMAFIRSDGSRYRVFRHGKDSWFINERGEKYTEDLSSLWWHGLNRSMYAQIFAVGLEDLQGAGFLSQDDVRSRFFMLQGGDRLSDAKRILSGRMEELLVPSFQGKRKINQLLKSLGETEEQLGKLSVQEREFAELQRKQREIKQELAAVNERIKKTAADDKKLEKQLGAWEYYKRGRDIRRRLDLSEQVKMFPSNGKEQWNNLVARMEVLHDQKGPLQKKIEEYTPKTKEEIIPWAGCADELENLYVDLGQWRQTIVDEEDLRKEKAAWEADYIALGPTLSLWGRPLPLGEDCFSVNWEEGRKLAQEINRRNNELHFCESREPLIEKLEEEPSEEGGIRSEAEWQLFEKTAERIEDLTYQHNRIKEDIKVLSQQEVQHYTLWFWLGLLFTACAAVGIVLFYLSYAGYISLYGAAASAATALVAFYINARLAHQKEKKMNLLEMQEKSICDEREILAVQIHMTVPSDEAALADFRNRVQQKQADFYKQQAKAQAVAWKKETVERQREEYEKWQARLEKLKKDKAATDGDWADWIKRNGLPAANADDLSALQEQWQKIYSAQGKGKILDVLLEKAQKKLNDFRTRASAVIETTGLSLPVTPDSIADVYEENRKRLLEWQAIAEKNKQHKVYQNEMDRLEDQWLACQKEMNTLFSLVKAQNADEFAERVLAHEQHDQLKKEWDTVRQDMRLYAGSEKEFQELWKALETGQYEERMAAHQKYTEAIKKDTERLGELQKQQGSAESEILRLANDNTITRLLQEKQEIQTELTEATEQWLTAMYASYFMEEAQKQYESGKRPKIISGANAFMQAMTGGRYMLNISEDGKEIYITDSAHNQKEAKIWSSGTGDQVYLALRLSMALAFGKQIEPLPIVLDDIFVRFDETRQRETLRFLFDLGREQQVFLFTCHEQTMRIAQEVGQEKDTGCFIRLQSGHVQQTDKT